MENQKDGYVLSMFEVCELLNKSKRSVSRYIRRGLLRPIQIKSRQGTLEYRFSEIEVKDFKTGQPRQDYTEGTGPPGQDRQEHEIYEHPNLKEYSPQTRRDQPDTKNRTTSATKNETPGESRFDEETRRDTKEKNGQKGQDSQDGFAGLINRTVEALTHQLKIKDEQLEAKDKHIDKLTDKIGGLIERNKELNYLMKGLQDRVPMLEAPRTRKGRRPKQEIEVQETGEGKGEEIQEPEVRLTPKPGAQEAHEAPKPPKGEKYEPAGRQQAAEQAAEQAETPPQEAAEAEEPIAEAAPPKAGIFRRIFRRSQV